MIEFEPAIDAPQPNQAVAPVAVKADGAGLPGARNCRMPVNRLKSGECRLRWLLGESAFVPSSGVNPFVGGSTAQHDPGPQTGRVDLRDNTVSFGRAPVRGRADVRQDDSAETRRIGRGLVGGDCVLPDNVVFGLSLCAHSNPLL